MQEFCQEPDKMSKDVKQMPWQVSLSLNGGGCEVNLSPKRQRKKINKKPPLSCYSIYQRA